MKKKNFEYNSILLFIMMMLANGCNYIFQIAIARLIDDAGQYAVINTLISLQAVFLIPNTLMVMVTAKYTALFDTIDEHKRCGIKTIKKVYNMDCYRNVTCRLWHFACVG